MYSIKPGRGPSLMGVLGGIIAIVFGVFWISLASSVGAPPFFVLFGFLFVGIAIVSIVYNLYNATSRDRLSDFDVTTDSEEGDPIANALGHGAASELSPQDNASKGQRQFPGEYCPYCGARVGPDFNFCPKCGKDI